MPYFMQTHSPTSPTTDKMSGPNDNDLSVTEYTQRLQAVLENTLPACWIHGEISNFTEATSGHWYFNLKEAQAQIRCVMFRFRQNASAIRPANGLAVRLRGTLSYYAPNGTCQILVEALRPAGQGALFEAFNRLKQRFATEGYFDEARKRPLPPFPRSVGVLTSPAGAAWRDIVTTLKRRAPQVNLILYPIPVQGVGAADEIARVLTLAGQRRDAEVLLLCRGGGSMEDLWAFNEPPVVEALFCCTLPVISGIGHETDFTLADFVADHRAPTPTAAAELVHPEWTGLQRQLHQLAQRQRQATQRRLERATLQGDTLRLRWEQAQRRYWETQRHHLEQQAQRLVHPGQQVLLQQRQLAHLHQRWQMLNRQLPLVLRQHLNDTTQRWQLATQYHFRVKHQHLDHLAQSLNLLSPHAILGRGYALIQDQQGHIIDQVESLKTRQHVSLILSNGTRQAEILPEAHSS